MFKFNLVNEENNPAFVSIKNDIKNLNYHYDSMLKFYQRRNEEKTKLVKELYKCKNIVPLSHKKYKEMYDECFSRVLQEHKNS